MTTEFRYPPVLATDADDAPSEWEVVATGSSTARALRDHMGDAAQVRARSALNTSVRRIDVSAARAEPAQSPLTTPVPYVGSEFVHPDVLYFAEGWNGYRYWMAITPFQNGDSQYENPSIYASHDGQSWVTPAGLTNPVIPYPGSPNFNADPCLVDGLDGRLYMFYKVAGNASTVQTRVTWSSDGVTWSTPVTAISEAVGSGTTFSPSVMFDGRQWVMYHMSNPSAPTIKRRTASSPFGPWSAASAITITSPPPGREYWHQTAISYGGRVLMLIQDGSTGNSGGNGDLYFAWSDDGTTFTRGASPVLAHDFTVRAGGDWHATIYRSAFAVLDDGHETRIPIWYTAKSVGGVWQLGYTEARLRRDRIAEVLAALNVSELESLRASQQLGSGVVFDNFRRPDSSTGLGVSRSGHPWVASSSTWGISGGRAYVPASANNIATIAVAADVRVGMQISTYAAGLFLIWRYQDASNFFRVGTFGTLGADATYYVQRIQTTATTLATGIWTARSGDWVEVETSGSAISIYINGQLAWSGTDSYLSATTNVGMQTASTVGRIGAFFAQATTPPAVTTFSPSVVSSSGAPPTASADYRGVIWITRSGAGVKDTVQVCAKDAGDAYAWRTIY